MIRLALRCRSSDAEAVLAELVDLIPSGFEEVDEPDGREGVVEYAIYGAPGEIPELGTLQAVVGEALIEVRSERVPDDWRERWKRFYHPLLVAGRLYVRPPWERPAERGGVVEVVIDPGRAFGTGTHPTTSMCLELLLDAAPGRAGRQRLLRRQSRSICDLGCGSGVLAIAAAKLGFEPVLGVDIEPVALEESARNARLNYIEIELQRLDLRERQAPLADVVSANLTTGLLEGVAGNWREAGRRPDTMIAAGFLASEVERVREVLASAGLVERRRLKDGEWGALLADAPS